MKNFFKKLSFVMAAAMVISSLYAPAAKAAAKDSITLKGKAISKKSIFVGGEKVNFDYKIGKFNNKGANGKWSTSDTSIITVNKHGVVTAVGTGDATLMLKVKKNTKKGIKKNLTFKVKLTAFARASKLEIPASDKAISLKVGEVKDIIPTLTNKVDGVDTTYKVFAKSSDENVAKAKVVDNSKVVVEPIMPSATPATITVFAAQKSNEDDAFDNKYKVEDSFTVTVVGDLSAEQSAANKIKVMGTDLATKAAAYVLKNDKGIVQNLKAVKELENGSVELEGTLTQFPEGKYTLTYDSKEVTVDIVKAMSKEIKLMPEDKAIAVLNSSNKYDKAFVKFAVYDQFGNDVTGTSLVSIKVTGSHAAAIDSVEKNKIVFTESNGFQLGISKVNVNLYDLNNTKQTVSLSANLDITNESRVVEAVYEGLWDKDAGKKIENFDEGTDLSSKNYYAIYSFKDQYGNAVNYHANIEKELNVSAIGITNVTIAAGASAKIEDKTNKKEYVGFKFSKLTGADKLREGEVELRLSIFAKASNSISNKFNVTHVAKVHDINIYVGTKGFYAGQKNELAFAATDLDGKEVKKYSVLKDVTFSDAKLKWEPKDANDAETEGKLVYDATTGVTVTGTSDTASQSLYFVATTKTNVIKQFTLSISKKKMVASLIGLQDKVAVGVTKDNYLTLRYKDLKFQDQYGGILDQKEIVETLGYNDVKVKAEFVNAAQEAFDTSSGSEKLANTETALSATTITDAGDEATLYTATTVMAHIKAKGDKSASEQLKISVLKGTDPVGSPLVIDLHSILLKDVTNIKVEDVKLQSTHDAYKDDPSLGFDITTSDEKHFDLAPVVTGTYKGQIIKLVNVNDFTLVGGVDKDGGSANTNFVNVPGRSAFNTTLKNTLEGSFKLIFKTGEIVEKKYEYTKDLPRISKLSIKDDKTVIELGDIAHNTPRNWTSIASELKLEDQFGRSDKLVAADVKPYIVFTQTDGITISNNATQTASFTVDATDANKVYQVKVKIIIGSYVFEGVVTTKATT